ncbi:MAG: hypothetical protein HXX10_07415 [Rhodoplanes sp.]|uniref:hypothetical protein n=1 Tax=Rhodoplanes sp. TaxID=1968906 RepID=UPI0017E899A6|nr:hypothetical protein [Rhodoplanes sp.]NVO13848.1 hypothetical protein [Rhodoplanes sp.]
MTRTSDPDLIDKACRIVGAVRSTTPTRLPPGTVLTSDVIRHLREGGLAVYEKERIAPITISTSIPIPARPDLAAWVRAEELEASLLRIAVVLARDGYVIITETPEPDGRTRLRVDLACIKPKDPGQ